MMEKLTKEIFEQWVKDNKWLQIGEAPTLNGRQVTYLSPAGQVTAAIYNLKGELGSIGHPPVITVPMPTAGRSPLDFLGGSHSPR